MNNLILLNNNDFVTHWNLWICCFSDGWNVIQESHFALFYLCMTFSLFFLYLSSNCLHCYTPLPPPPNPTSSSANLSTGIKCHQGTWLPCVPVRKWNPSHFQKKDWCIGLVLLVFERLPPGTWYGLTGLDWPTWAKSGCLFNGWRIVCLGGKGKTGLTWGQYLHILLCLIMPRLVK